ncbi:MAG: TetR family transcriptional regulator [Actinomycetaceae bacterium]|nr:TetR family transcriptional regulator [Actinomycetaceae bacterium]
MHEPPKRGRRPGAEDVRPVILEAAQREFARIGYEKATVRGIASLAGVDPKLVHYYFGTKSELFKKSVAEVVMTEEFFDSLLEIDDTAGSLGAKFLRSVLRVYETPAIGSAAVGLIRNIFTHDKSRRLLLEIYSNYILKNIAHRLPGPDPVARVNLVGTQMFGIIAMRYILRVPVIAELSIDDVSRLIGPTLDRYLFGEWPQEPSQKE